MMLCLLCDQQPCACTKPVVGNPLAQIRSTEQPKSAYDGKNFVTKEEFGVALYDVVTIIGRILWCQDAYGRSVMEGDNSEMARYLTIRKGLRVVLAQQIVRLSDADAAAVAHRYPWVAHV